MWIDIEYSNISFQLEYIACVTKYKRDVWKKGSQQKKSSRIKGEYMLWRLFLQHFLSFSRQTSITRMEKIVYFQECGKANGSASLVWQSYLMIMMDGSFTCTFYVVLCINVFEWKQRFSYFFFLVRLVSYHWR